MGAQGAHCQPCGLCSTGPVDAGWWPPGPRRWPCSEAEKHCPGPAGVWRGQQLLNPLRVFLLFPQKRRGLMCGTRSPVPLGRIAERDSRPSPQPVCSVPPRSRAGPLFLASAELLLEPRGVTPQSPHLTNEPRTRPLSSPHVLAHLRLTERPRISQTFKFWLLFAQRPS